MITDLIDSLINKYNKAYPGCWQRIADMRHDRGTKLPDWPDWCYCPMAAAYAIISAGKVMSLDLAQRYPPGELAALAAWKISKGVYRFDKSLFEELIIMPMEGDIPSQLFYRLPEWGVCIETPGLSFLGADIEGILAHLEYDVNHNYAELRILALKNEDGAIPVILHLGDYTIQESVDILLEETAEMMQRYNAAYPAGVDMNEVRKEYAADVTPFLNIILYLCSENAEYREVKRPYKPTENIIKHTHTGYFETKAPKFWHLGDNTGRILREVKASEDETTVISESGTHASPHAHIRRAHWHHFWTGPKDDPAKRKLVLRWLPPMLVGQE
jgi:hypothetical protein